MEEVNNGTMTTMPILDAGHTNKFAQIQTATDQNGEHALYALDTGGVVWKFDNDVFTPRWIPLVMTRAAH